MHVCCCRPMCCVLYEVHISKWCYSTITVVSVCTSGTSTEYRPRRTLPQVAAAPRMRAAKVAQLEELQDEVPLALHVAGGEGRDIDLSLLTSFLCAYDQVG